MYLDDLLRCIEIWALDFISLGLLYVVDFLDML